MSTVHADAAALIEAQGFHQGGFYPGWDDTIEAPNRYESAELINRDSTPCCVVGALTACGGGDPEIEALAAHLLTATGARLPIADKAEEVVVQWNDNPATTKDDVVTALRAVRS